MVAAVRVHKAGGPEVLTYEDIEIPAPGPGQVRLKQHAAGINFIDTYFRIGMYPAPNGMPFVAGNEGTGEVIALGAGVTDLKVGDRVGYVVPLGAYAAERNLPAERAVKLPAAISYEQAAATMLKGMTVCYLVRHTFEVKPGNTVLIHAAMPAASASSPPNGRTCWVRPSSARSAPRRRRSLPGPTAATTPSSTATRTSSPGSRTSPRARCAMFVYYDGVGKTTFMASLDCLRPLGMFVSFGSASGPVEAFNINLLQAKGSLFATRPTLNHYAAKREDLLKLAAETFDVIMSGKVKIPVNQKYPLKDARQAHIDLESRSTTGASILLT